MRGLVVGVIGVCLSACGSTGNTPGRGTDGGGPTLNLPAPSEGSEQYLRLCGRYGLGQLRSVAQSPDRALIAVGGTDLALIFNAAEGRILHRYRVEGAVTGVAFMEGGAKLAVVTRSLAQLFDVSTEAVLASAESPVPDGGLGLASIAVAADGSFAVAWNLFIRFYSAAWQPLRDVNAVDGRWTLNPPVFMPGSSELLLSTNAGVASIVPDVAEATILYPTSEPSLAVAVAPGGLIAAGGAGGQVWVWRRGEAAPLLQKFVTGGAASVAFSGDGRLVAAGNSVEVHVWEVATGTERLSFNPKFRDWATSSFGSGLRFNAGDDAILVTDDFRIHSYGLNTAVEGPGYGWGHDDLWESAAIAPDGTLLASSARDQVIVWKREDESIVSRLVPPGSGLSGRVTFSPNGRLYSTAAGTVYEWDWSSGTLLRTLKLNISRIGTLMAAPDGKKILAGLGGNEFVTVSTETMQPIAHVPALDTSAEQSVFTADSNAFVSTINSEELGAWDANSGAPLATAPLGDRLNFNSIVMASGGTRVVTAAGSAVQVLGWPGLETKYRLPHQGGINMLTPIGDDHHFLSIGSDVKLWDVNQGSEVSTGSVDINGVPRIALPPGMSASIIMARNTSLRLYCNALAKPTDPASFVDPPR